MLRIRRALTIFSRLVYLPMGKVTSSYINQVAREDRSVVLNDEAVKIVLNTKGMAGDISEELKDTLRFMDGHMPTTKYAKELESAVEAVKANEEWRREYMTLFLRDRENVRLGGHITKVEQIRHNMGTQPVDTIASFIVLPESKCNEVIDLIKAHPDWDDEQVAEEVEWA